MELHQVLKNTLRIPDLIKSVVTQFEIDFQISNTAGNGYHHPISHSIILSLWVLVFAKR